MGSTPANQSNWQPTIPIDQSIYEPNTTQQATIGTRLEVGDRVFYYAQATASVGAGRVVCAPGPVASHQSGIFTIAATSAGAKVISGTSSANVAANLYAEGYYGQAVGAGAGEMYRIRANASGSAGIAITLYDALNQAVTSGSGFWLLQNQYKNVLVGSLALGMPVGVTPTAVTSGAYFWLQTWGPCNPVHTGALTAAAAIKMGTLGAVAAAYPAATDGPGIAALVIGKVYNLASTDAENNPVFLTIRP